jgi:hypothetical protein
MSALALVLVLAFQLVVATAHADVPTCDQTCSVNRNCSSTGVACNPADRECTNGATAKGLEVKCEQSCDTGKVFVYCPPDTGRSDSGFVWVLLVLAGVLAVGGTGVAWVVLRKKT